MKKVISLLASLVVCFLMMVPVNAAPDIGVGTKGGAADAVAKGSGFDVTGVNDTTLSSSIGRIIKVALTMVGTIFFALTVYAGFLWMTAQGNDEQVTKATSILKNAILGLILVLSAYGITVFALIYTSRATGSTVNSPAVGK